MHNNYYRDYNPVIGRYVQVDPIGIMRGQNHLYVYAAANPVNMFDYFGLHHIPFPTPPNPKSYKDECELIRGLYKAVMEAITTLKHDLEHMRSNTYDYWISNVTRAEQIQIKILQLEKWKRDSDYLFYQIVMICKPCDW